MVLTLAAGLVWAQAPTLIDFEDLPTTGVFGDGPRLAGQYFSDGVIFSDTDCTTCEGEILQGSTWVFINSVFAAGPEAELTAAFVDPFGDPTTASQISVDVGECDNCGGLPITPATKVQSFDLAGTKIDSCVIDFISRTGMADAGFTCPAVIDGPVETTRDVIVTLAFDGRRAKIKFIDHGTDGHLIDNLTFTLNPSKAQCKKGGWQEYGFRNQGQCIRFVNTGKDSR